MWHHRKWHPCGVGVFSHKDQDPQVYHYPSFVATLVPLEAASQVTKGKFSVFSVHSESGVGNECR